MRSAKTGAAMAVAGVAVAATHAGGAAHVQHQAVHQAAAAKAVPVHLTAATTVTQAADSSGSTYTVQAGDTLSSIANQLGVSWQQLWQANSGTVPDPNTIYAGQVLSVPGSGTSDQAPAASTAPSDQSASTDQSAPAPSDQTQSAPSSSSSSGSASPGSFQSCVLNAESGGNYSAVNSSSGAGGAYQFMPSTWASLGYSGSPQDASPAQQDQAFQTLYAQDGSAPWASDGC
jgi:LysM repeat protein